MPPVAALPASPRLFAWHPASLETPPLAALPLAGSTQCSIKHGVTHEAHQHTGPQPHTHTQPTAATKGRPTLSDVDSDMVRLVSDTASATLASKT